MEAFCKSVLLSSEKLLKTFYYDCPPFSETRPLPVSKTLKNFAGNYVHQKATAFQQFVKQNPFFEYRGGHLSFDGWALTDHATKSLLALPRPLTDDDFSPILRQKQVDMKIGFDVAKLAIGKMVGRILLCTSDADFIPAIHFAKSQGLEVALLSDVTSVRKTKSKLLKAFTSHRIV